MEHIIVPSLEKRKLCLQRHFVLSRKPKTYSHCKTPTFPITLSQDGGSHAPGPPVLASASTSHRCGCDPSGIVSSAQPAGWVGYTQSHCVNQVNPNVDLLLDSWGAHHCPPNPHCCKALLPLVSARTLLHVAKLAGQAQLPVSPDL